MIMGVTASTSTGIMTDQFSSVQNGKKLLCRARLEWNISRKLGGGERKKQPEILWRRETFLQEDSVFFPLFGLPEKKHAHRLVGV